MLTIDSPLPGEHQRRNIALAIAASVALREPAQVLKDGETLHVYAIPDAAILGGIHETKWPGRLETIAPNFLLDVAHNPAGA